MEKIIEVDEWSITFDSYQRPIIKNNVRNTLLLSLKIEEEKAIVNDKLILYKDRCTDFNNKYKNEIVEQLYKWLKS